MYNFIKQSNCTPGHLIKKDNTGVNTVLNTGVNIRLNTRVNT